MENLSVFSRRSFFAILFTLTINLSAFGSEPTWLEIRSEHFSVVTDAGDKRGREVAMRFEQMRSVFGALMTKANVNIPVPLQIVAFRNTKEFRQFAPLWKGKPTQLAGLFQGGQDRSFIMLDMSVENPWYVVFHEYAHQLMNGILTQQLDPWFEEGFAEYFASIEVDSKQARVGKVPASEYQTLQQGGMMKIADLFRVRQNSQTYNESGDRRSVFYAQSGMLVHYLYDNQLIPKLATYFDLEINRNMRVEDAIQQTFGMSSGQFDKVFREYAFSGRYKFYVVATPSTIISNNFTSAPVSSADSRAVLADIHLHSPDYQDKAITEFQDVLKEDPNNAAASRGLGYAYLQRQDFKQATDYFQRASQANSKDPRVHYYSALLMSRDGSFSDHSKLPDTIKELETSISLDPNFADSYMLLGIAQMNNRNMPKALEAMQKAVALSPRNEGYRYDLARIYMSDRKYDEAISLLQGLQKTQTPQLAAPVAQTLLQAQELKREMQDKPISSGATEVFVQAAAADHRTGPQMGADESNSNRFAPDSAPKAARFLKGVITGVDCSSPPMAVVTVAAGPKTWKMNVHDSDHVVVLGADKFSCAWTKQKVAFNYRDAGDAAGDVISIEIQ